jgi:hypothetical protein
VASVIVAVLPCRYPDSLVCRFRQEWPLRANPIVQCAFCVLIGLVDLTILSQVIVVVLPVGRNANAQSFRCFGHIIPR